MSFCLKLPETFIRIPICVSKTIWYRRVYAKKGLSRFSVEIFASKYRKNFVGEFFCKSKVLLYGSNFWIRRRGFTILSKFFISQYQRNSVGERVCISEISWYQRFKTIGEDSLFSSLFFVSMYLKVF